MADKIPYKTYLSEDEMPKQWLNIKGFMKNKPDPMLNPATMQPCVKEDLTPVFCDKLVDQELNATDKYIDIPQPVLDFYKLYRPSPLVRAYRAKYQLYFGFLLEIALLCLNHFA